MSGALSGSANADRHRAQRRKWQRDYRKRGGLIKIAPVPYDATTLDYLIALGWLKESDSKDRRKIGDGIARALAESAKSQAAKR